MVWDSCVGWILPLWLLMMEAGIDEHIMYIPSTSEYGCHNADCSGSWTKTCWCRRIITLKGNEMSELKTPSYYVTVLSDPLNGKVTQAQGCLKVWNIQAFYTIFHCCNNIYLWSFKGRKALGRSDSWPGRCTCWYLLEVVCWCFESSILGGPWKMLVKEDPSGEQISKQLIWALTFWWREMA